MSHVEFASEHGSAQLAGSEGAYLCHLPRALAIGLLEPGAFGACENYLQFIAPTSNLRQAPDGTFGERFTLAWNYGLHGTYADFAWRGRELNTHAISLNTALAAGSDPIRFACRFGAKGTVYIEGVHRAWLADICDEGLATGVYRGPGQGWEQVAAFLRARDDEAVAVNFSSEGERFPHPYYGGWFPPELGNDYTKLTAEQIPAWEKLQDDWLELPVAEQWAIGLPALRASREGIEINPGTWRELRFKPRLTVFDLLAPDRAARLDRALGMSGTTKEVP